MDLPMPEEYANAGGRMLKDGLQEAYLEKYVGTMLRNLGLGRKEGRTLFVTGDRREMLFKALEEVPEHGRALDLEDVDVKDLLETGKIVLERSALKEMIEQHQSDLISRVFIKGSPPTGPAVGQKVLGA